MKHLIAFILVNTCCLSTYAQFTIPLKADSVRIHNDSCKAELIIENSTKDVPGFLFNRGKGRTEFRKAAVKLNDSAYVFGNDTLKLGVSKETDPSAIRNQYSIGQNASFWINGRGRTRGLFTADSSIGFGYQYSDPSNPVEGQLYYNSTYRKFRGHTDSTWHNFLMNEQKEDAHLSKLYLNDDAYIADNSGIEIEPGIVYMSGHLSLGSKRNTRPYINIDGTIRSTILKVNPSAMYFPEPVIDISGPNTYASGPVMKIDITNDHPNYEQTGIDVAITKKVQGNDLYLYGAGIYGVKSTVTSYNKAGQYNANFYALYAKAVKKVPDSLRPLNMYALYADSGTVFIREKMITQGAHEVKRTVLTDSVTLNDTHYYLASDASARAFIITLPEASTCNGRIYIIKKIDNTANAVTITPSASAKIDGASSILLSAQWQKATIISTGANWEII